MICLLEGLFEFLWLFALFASGEEGVKTVEKVAF